MIKLLVMLYMTHVLCNVCLFFHHIGRGSGPYTDYTDNYRLGSVVRGGRGRYSSGGGGAGGGYYE